ncbi:amidase [Ponticoccus sp. SC2-23]|uniref:amidase n=1 Tax=Alexandriicola marinus TaxID=2081710 RepID=UPI000FD81AA0|nr:amidase [Alexandriicola marinus]MBM1219306.1 amidase [Ponticoccus sp. SC6-9]MBM1223622.1 amidase [Ponticoccus sp. SC6-15]MBM1229119.1 amidase [Ponticoccus sp. SC6-38]MBM1232588.1 amidase [Ponticoccus sp. SC6-45]MBM1237462.1 amidase [Ponticoccus sp. SC6-49]MBM1241599.1 amidase [Ponticoccus sp. SC2-64]MBM1246112.1 amidase [Ponticoccus sp. SC6-42]MBM1250590.1 amidase [Ponticoccus sp. SC6-33]MBM1255471.1 amidase [Ponticoccus sp. SC6-60]MBM1259977.1 amidase [Ponticoccus sp. SC6-31]MBM12642
MDDLIRAGGLALSDAVARKDISASELMAATLDRIDRINPDLNAIVSLRDRDSLMDEARQAEGAERKGWLHGIPIAIKDLSNAKGLPTTMGSPLFAGQVAEGDSLFVSRLRAAGAIVIGKTNTPEFGLGSQTYNAVFGATSNPYDRARTCGGSSGGAAVALATGLLSVADGSDMMGSLRNPAGWNNVYGMRPSWGLVPADPIGDSFLHQLSTAGPMARNPRDLGAMLETMAGPDPRLPHARGSGSMADIAPLADGVRIGWLGDWGGAFAYEAGVADLCLRALQAFGDLGARVEEIAPPHSAEAIWRSWTTLRSWQVTTGIEPLYATPASRERLKPEAIWEVERGLSYSGMEIHKASVLRSDWFRKAAEVFGQVDVLALPSAQVFPFDKTVEWPRDIAGRQMDTYHRWMEVMIAASLIGLPVVNVPVGFSEAGLPMGMQLIGPRGSDRRLLELAQAWHEATDWPAAQRPPGT